jgi:hypothetical protein
MLQKYWKQVLQMENTGLWQFYDKGNRK